jgi:hypothetical protein
MIDEGAVNAVVHVISAGPDMCVDVRLDLDQ